MRERDRDRERDKERGKKRDKKEDIGPPGAGTLWVYDVDLEDRPSRRPLSRGKAISKERTSRRDVNTWEGYCQVSRSGDIADSRYRMTRSDRSRPTVSWSVA